MSSKAKITFSDDRAGERIRFQEAYAVKTPSLIPESRRALILSLHKILACKNLSRFNRGAQYEFF